MIILRGVRWFIGVPLGYVVYYWLLRLNTAVMNYFIKWIPNETFWSIEIIFAGAIVSVYFGVLTAYLILPKDDFPLINNKKVKAIKYATNLWIVLQLIFFGVAANDIINYGFVNGNVYYAIYPLIACFFIKTSYNSVALVDFNHNKVYRDYYEQHSQDEGTKQLIDYAQ
jgi:hypothetical protein